MKITYKKPLNRPTLKWGWSETEGGIIDTADKLGIAYDHRMTFQKLRQLCFDRLIELKNERTFDGTFVPEGHVLVVLRSIEAAGFEFVRTSADATMRCNPDYVLRFLLHPPPDPEPVREAVREAVRAVETTRPPQKKRSKRKNKSSSKKSWSGRYGGI